MRVRKVPTKQETKSVYSVEQFQRLYPNQIIKLFEVGKFTILPLKRKKYDA